MTGFKVHLGDARGIEGNLDFSVGSNEDIVVFCKWCRVVNLVHSS